MQRRAREFCADISRRRTVRDFSDRPIPDGIIDDCLRAAASAPSGANMQPWHFCDFRSRHQTQDPHRSGGGRAAFLCASGYAGMAGRAGAARHRFGQAVSGNGTVSDRRIRPAWGLSAGRSQGQTLLPGRVGRPGLRLLIAGLHHAGLATLTHTPSPMGFLNEILERPKNERPFLLLVTGYPTDDARVPAISRRPPEQSVTWHSQDE